MQATLNGWIETGVDQISGERRLRQRFGLRLPLQYRVLGLKMPVTGYGTTRDLSSGGIAFETEEELLPGYQVELAVQWPVPLECGTPLKLVVRGTLLRSEGRAAAIRVQRCQFRTQKRVRAAGSDYAY